jgi:hypothetical protein
MKNRFCLEVRAEGKRVGVQGRGRNDPNNVCPYAYVNK